MSEKRAVGILTSGGDAPGMNAAIRAVTRAAIVAGFKVYGIMRGYRGLITDEIQEFSTQNVSNIIQRGGTILKPRVAKNSLLRRDVSALMMFFSVMASTVLWLSEVTGL